MTRIPRSFRRRRVLCCRRRIPGAEAKLVRLLEDGRAKDPRQLTREFAEVAESPEAVRVIAGPSVPRSPQGARPVARPRSGTPDRAPRPEDLRARPGRVPPLYARLYRQAAIRPVGRLRPAPRGRPDDDPRPRGHPRQRGRLDQPPACPDCTGDVRPRARGGSAPRLPPRRESIRPGVLDAREVRLGEGCRSDHRRAPRNPENSPRLHDTRRGQVSDQLPRPAAARLSRSRWTTWSPVRGCGRHGRSRA